MTEYSSPLGRILISCDGSSITGLWFEDQKNVPVTASDVHENSEILSLAIQWLDEYFSGREPSFSVPVKPSGTDFQMKVWDILTTIPYGAVMTYKEIATKLSKDKRMSAQAVGQAVGNNPVSIIIPCHRVIGSDGTLTGYTGGLERKRYMLELEGVTVMGGKTVMRHDATVAGFLTET